MSPHYDETQWSFNYVENEVSGHCLRVECVPGGGHYNET